MDIERYEVNPYLNQIVNLAGRVGLEPTANALTGRRSTIELPTNKTLCSPRSGFSVKTQFTEANDLSQACQLTSHQTCFVVPASLYAYHPIYLLVCLKGAELLFSVALYFCVVNVFVCTVCLLLCRLFFFAFFVLDGVSISTRNKLSRKKLELSDLFSEQKELTRKIFDMVRETSVFSRFVTIAVKTTLKRLDLGLAHSKK